MKLTKRIKRWKEKDIGINPNDRGDYWFWWFFRVLWLLAATWGALIGSLIIWLLTRK